MSKGLGLTFAILSSTALFFAPYLSSELSFLEDNFIRSVARNLIMVPVCALVLRRIAEDVRRGDLTILSGIKDCMVQRTGTGSLKRAVLKFTDIFTGMFLGLALSIYFLGRNQVGETSPFIVIVESAQATLLLIVLSGGLYQLYVAYFRADLVRIAAVGAGATKAGVAVAVSESTERHAFTSANVGRETSNTLRI